MNGVDIQLTAEQLAQLEPLFQRAREDARKGAQGALVAQPFSDLDEAPDDPEKCQPGRMRVGYLTNEYASIVADVLRLRRKYESAERSPVRGAGPAGTPSGPVAGSRRNGEDRSINPDGVRAGRSNGRDDRVAVRVPDGSQ